MGTAALGRDYVAPALSGRIGLSAIAGKSREQFFVWIVAIALAAGTAALDVVLGDTSTSLIAILFFATGIAYFGPRRAWRWGLLFGAFLPLGHLVTRRSGELSGVLAFLPSFIGAYLGAFLEKMVRELKGSP